MSKNTCLGKRYSASCRNSYQRLEDTVFEPRYSTMAVESTNRLIHLLIGMFTKLPSIFQIVKQQD